MVDIDPTVRERYELSALTRSYAGLVHKIRVERLGERMRRTESIAVSRSTSGMCGDRLTLWLDSGDVLQLRLFWPLRSHVAALRGIRWADEVGWVADVRTTSGEHRRVYAWRARLTYTDVGGS